MLTLTPLWPLCIEPLLTALRPGRVLQVGAGDGETSLELLAYCRRSGCRAEIIEPRPAPDMPERLGPFADEHAFVKLLPLKAISMATHADLVLLDGEPNWWTVFEALQLLRRLSAERGEAFPVVLAHHTAWPYGRRDMYPNPDYVEEKHPFSHQGLDPDRAELVEEGLNARFAHATHEGGPRNGVLTALEDFIAGAPLELEFWNLPVFGGLGVLAPRARMTAELRAAIEGLFAPGSLIRAAQAVELEAARTAVLLAAAESRLARRTQALKRARDMIERQEADLAELRRQVSLKPKA